MRGIAESFRDFAHCSCVVVWEKNEKKKRRKEEKKKRRKEEKKKRRKEEKKKRRKEGKNSFFLLPFHHNIIEKDRVEENTIMDDAVVEAWATCAQQSLMNNASYYAFAEKLRAHYATLEQFQSVRGQIIDCVLRGFGSVTDKKYGLINVMNAIITYRKLVEERQERRMKTSRHGLQPEKTAQYRILLCINKKYTEKSSYLVGKISKLLFPPPDVEVELEEEEEEEEETVITETETTGVCEVQSIPSCINEAEDVDEEVDEGEKEPDEVKGEVGGGEKEAEAALFEAVEVKEAVAERKKVPWKCPWQEEKETKERTFAALTID